MNPHETQTRVHYHDTDQMGIVYYSQYLVYFEIGRTEFLRDHGMVYRDLEASGLRLPVVEVHIRYRHPARYDDMLTIQTWVTQLRRTRIDFSHKILNEAGALLSEGYAVLACVNEQGTPMRLPDEVVALIEPTLST